mmetsp:Transcript_11446/g.70315  ORF Transcript_11446/g.70315 Transcript_11446/m.70315 type:complete len:268 (-) Transcript_11446:939-1742(-)
MVCCIHTIVSALPSYLRIEHCLFKLDGNLGYFALFDQFGFRTLHLFPALGHQAHATSAFRVDDAEIVPCGGQIVRSCVSHGKHHSTYNVAWTETFDHVHFVDLGGANVLHAYDSAESLTQRSRTHAKHVAGRKTTVDFSHTCRDHVAHVRHACAAVPRTHVRLVSLHGRVAKHARHQAAVLQARPTTCTHVGSIHVQHVSWTDRERRVRRHPRAMRASHVLTSAGRFDEKRSMCASGTKYDSLTQGAVKEGSTGSSHEEGCSNQNLQ